MKPAPVNPDAALDDKLCDLLVSWDGLEKRLGNEMFLDQNMIGWKPRREYERRADVVRDVTKLREAYPDDDSYGRQLDRLLFYVDDLIDPHKASTEDRIEKLLGVRFQPFAADIVSETRTDVIEKAKALGYAFDAQLENALRSQDKIVTPEALPALVDDVYLDGIKQFENLTGLPVQAHYSSELTSTNAGWDAYSSGEGDHFVIRINKNRPNNLLQERMKGLIRHEVLGHAVYHTTNLKNIQAGILPRSVGLILLPGADMIADEGCAEISRRIHCTSPYGLLLESIQDYNKLCLAQAIQVQHSQSTALAKEQYMDMVPYGDLSRLTNDLKEVVHDPFWRYYRWSYPCARSFFNQASNSLDTEKFGSFLRACYEAPRDVQDLAGLAFAHGMSADQINKTLHPAREFIPDTNPHILRRPEEIRRAPGTDPASNPT